MTAQNHTTTGEIGPSSGADGPQDHRTRRSFMAALAGATGVFVAQALGRPATADAASVTLGTNNNETTQTKFTNTASNASAWALSGVTSYTGAAAASRGVVGISNGENGVGVAGQAHTGSSASGVLGLSNNGVAVRGQGGPTGVYGTGDSYGVRGLASAGYGLYGDGVYGLVATGTSAGAYGSSGSGYGVYGYGSTGTLGYGTGIGVRAQGGAYGVSSVGTSYGAFSSSVYVGTWSDGTNTATTGGGTYGVVGRIPTGALGYAGYFYGPVHSSAGYSSAGATSMIDHPVDASTRYLVHSQVQAPERLNVYSGTVTLDATGSATVGLPSYFEAANRDFRYQLTAIGAAAPSLHVSSKVKANRFSIAGGPAGLEVSWLVSGVRADAWATSNPLDPEQPKAKADIGKYLHPDLHGKSLAGEIGPRRPALTAEQSAAPQLPDAPRS